MMRPERAFIMPRNTALESRNTDLRLVSITAIERLDVEPGGIEVVDVGAAAFFEAGDDIGQHDDGPRRTAFEEREVELGEAAGDAAHQHRLGVRMAGFCEMADMVVHVRGRRAETDGLAATVYGDRYTKIDAVLPHRVVVVCAVDAEHIVVDALVRRAGHVATCS